MAAIVYFADALHGLNVVDEQHDLADWHTTLDEPIQHLQDASHEASMIIRSLRPD